MNEVPKIELLYLPGCPHVDATRGLLAECLDELGLTGMRIEERQGDYPSPSIIVDGVDVMGPPAGPAASCRLDLPTRERLVMSIRRTHESASAPKVLDAELRPLLASPGLPEGRCGRGATQPTLHSVTGGECD